MLRKIRPTLLSGLLGALCLGSGLAPAMAGDGPLPTELKDRHGEIVATVDYSATGVSVAPLIDFDRARIVVKGTQGLVYEAASPPASLHYAFADAQGNPLPDGAYTFEIVFVDDPLPGDTGPARSRSAVTAGRFLIEGGQLFVPRLDERPTKAASNVHAAVSGRQDGVTSISGQAFDQTGDYSISGKLTIATDDNPNIAVNDTFADDIYIKTTNLGTTSPGAGPGIYLERVNILDESSGNNPASQVTHGSFRINYEDTSTSSLGGLFTISSDPGARGGTGAFAERASMTIEERALANSLYLDSNGYVGLGTSSPLSALHISGLNSTIRVDDTAEAAWDIQQTSGDLRFRLHRAFSGGSTGEHLRITEEGSVGIGTSLPTATLHVVGNGIIEGDVAFGSSRTIKHEVDPIDTHGVLAAIRDLPIYSWKYKEDPVQATHVGPMAEDIYAAFRLGRDEKHLSPADSAGLALAAVQGVDREMSDLRSLVEMLTVENRVLLERLAALEDRLEKGGRETAD